MATSQEHRSGAHAPGPLTHPKDDAGSLAPVSVVIVNHDAGRLLADCLAAALAQARQVILVDNASQPVPFEAVAARFATHPRLTILRSRVNTGFATGCNQGAARADQSTILFLNPDCILGPGSLATLSRALVTGDRVGMVGGLLTDAGGREQGGARRSIPTPWRSFVRGFGLGRLSWLAPRWLSDFYLHREPLPTQAIDVEAVSGALTMVSREAFDQAGPWDEGFFLHCEDLDLCLRFRQAGWRILFVPDAPAVHHRGMCGRSRPLAVEWHKHQGMIRFYRKHFRHAYPAGLFGLVVAGVWLRFGLVAARQTVHRSLAAVARIASRPDRDAGPEADAVRVVDAVRVARAAPAPTLPS
ncbi:MAG: glycosyltransferase family 2 protein [Planctomycetota bacterium]